MAEESAITDALSLTKSILGAVAKPGASSGTAGAAANTGDHDAVDEKKSEVRTVETSQAAKTKRSYFKGKKVPKSTSNVSEYASTKAVGVVRGIDIARIVDLGLGRGVDSTSPTPWLSKSSFQVSPLCVCTAS